MNKIDILLKEKNIIIPNAPTPAANYVPYVITNNLIFVAGQGPFENGKINYTGKVGESIDIETAIKEACNIRLRPIIMTSLSTMIAMLPLVIGNFGPGAGEGSRLAVGSTILGGMIISTFFTLYVTPTMYLALAKNTKRIDAVDIELKKELR